MDHPIPKTLKFYVLIAYVYMVTVNAMANILPINGLNTGQISDSYPNLFAPAGVTFSIWGLIYLLLLFFALYQVGLFREPMQNDNLPLLARTSKLFIVNAIFNGLWIFAWHYQIIPLSMVIMIVLLLTLILLVRTLHHQTLSPRERFFIRLPILVYFGWITIATIANMAILLVSMGWTGLGIPESTWMIITLVVGVFIGCTAIAYTRSKAYGLVLIWAYIGIYLKHTSPSGFNSSYPEIIQFLYLSIALFSIAIILLLIFNRRKKSFFK